MDWGRPRVLAMIEGITAHRAVTLFAVGLSACVHLGLLVVLAMIFLKPPPAAGVGDDPQTLLASVSQIDLGELASSAPMGGSPQFSAPQPQDPFSDRTADLTIDFGTGVLNADMPSGLGGLREGDLGEGLDSALGGEGGASFFGVEARGSRFAYIVDVSGSMDNERMAALKHELTASVLAMVEQSHFTIVVYNSQAFSLTASKWMPGDEDSKAAIRTEIAGLQASGGTDPIPAFQMVFAMKPRPDAMYFMTDGEFADNDLVIATIARLNEQGSRPTPIHCITLGEEGAAEVMKKIARRSRGTYRHVSASGGAGSP